LTSGTHKTLNPFSENTLRILSNDELFPPQGPPVTTILYTGCFGLLLSQYCFVGVLRYTSLEFYLTHLASFDIAYKILFLKHFF